MGVMDKMARFLLAAIFVVFGVNGFVGFLPPPEAAPDGAQFLGLMIASGYLAVVKVLEIIGGLLLLIGRLPLGLTVLGPIVVNIVLFHLFLDPANIALAAVTFLLWAFLMWRNWSAFKPIVQGK
ncbi:MAG: hypothetical protein AAF481_08690 [Acidobacteriota bacterium]